jgi:transcriptional regulator with XRE-family HTH domain
MTIAELRAKKGMTLEAFANWLDLASKGYISDMEKAQKEKRRTICSVKLALKLEELSGGDIKASDLNPDIGLVEQARGFSGEAA